MAKNWQQLLRIEKLLSNTVTHHNIFEIQSN